jgi:peptidoglycan/LPS O-acetylase OafA/YrhL
LATAVPKLSLPRVERWGACTYEYFLIHGPIYLACVKLFDLSFWPALFVGTTIALLGTWLLCLLGAYSWKKWVTHWSNLPTAEVNEVSGNSFMGKNSLTRPADKFVIRRESRCEVKV